MRNEITTFKNDTTYLTKYVLLITSDINFHKSFLYKTTFLNRHYFL